MASIPCPSGPRAGDGIRFRGPAEVVGSERPPPSRARRAFLTSSYLLGQIALLGGLFMVYRLGRTLADGRRVEALRHALAVWHFERLLDLPDESSIQQLALRSTDLLEFANRFYITVHFPAAIAFLLWVMLFQRAHWRRVRNVIMLSTGVALVIHILYPLAPPRFLPAVSPNIPFVDTGVVIGPSAYNEVGAAQANQYAAMPSLHIGWAILEAWGVITILRWRARWLAVAHPIVTALVVVITANHYWLDGLIGGGLVWGAIVLTRQPRWDRVTAVTLAPARRVRAALRHRLPAEHPPAGPPSLDLVAAMARPIPPARQASSGTAPFALAQASARMRVHRQPETTEDDPQASSEPAAAAPHHERSDVTPGAV
ncbi:phosphatase PAP2 family protein [Pseudofrankia sp. BMG5.37]|uniref:phosphatase PAP2 family protein n=1 Tax=Pseudofrankia sp. BMG5.37 TaxID=3050035 RepID=UPI00289393F4|nr:phosphatase PAP2 family protein [Pseudofrankia sp. BMG5.37]MDT3443946.1 phosphatase PAP2 family protein [Pseudofrankia sp. BMG5.37]